MELTILNNSTFFSIVDKLKSGSNENVFQYNMEYYVGEDEILIYKQLQFKNYCTSVKLTKNIEADTFTVQFKGIEQTANEFLTQLRKNEQAIELLLPYFGGITRTTNIPTRPEM